MGGILSYYTDTNAPDMSQNTNNSPIVTSPMVAKKSESENTLSENSKSNNDLQSGGSKRRKRKNNLGRHKLRRVRKKRKRVHSRKKNIHLKSTGKYSKTVRYNKKRIPGKTNRYNKTSLRRTQIKNKHRDSKFWKGRQ